MGRISYKCFSLCREAARNYKFLLLLIIIIIMDQVILLLVPAPNEKNILTLKYFCMTLFIDTD
jgi:hypothetical protein